MFKAMILLKRREDISIQDFRSWWIGEHAPLARQLPGVRRICFNVVESEEALYDGVSTPHFQGSLPGCILCRIEACQMLGLHM